MKSIHRLGFALALAGVTGGCSLSSGAPDEPAGTTDQPIVGGHDINNGADDVASLFPLSTVTLVCTSPGGQCTGELLSSVQILTAAHCCPPGTSLSRVYQYDNVRGNTTYSSISTYTSSPPTPVIPDGVTGQNLPGGGFDSAGNYADLALLTLPAPLPLPVTATIPGLPGAYSSLKDQHTAVWEVGTGGHDGTRNAALAMKWIPVALLGKNDDSGMFAALSAEGAQTAPANPGDSGGPVYQLLGGTVLLVVGVTSFFNSTSSHFTSVLAPTNRNWIMNHYTTPPSGSPMPQIVRDLFAVNGLLPLAQVPSRAPGRGRAPFPELSAN